MFSPMITSIIFIVPMITYIHNIIWVLVTSTPVRTKYPGRPLIIYNRVCVPPTPCPMPLEEDKKVRVYNPNPILYPGIFDDRRQAAGGLFSGIWRVRDPHGGFTFFLEWFFNPLFLRWWLCKILVSISEDVLSWVNTNNISHGVI